MSNLVKRLREMANNPDFDFDAPTLNEAADRIERLEAALHDIASSVAVSRAGMKLLASAALDKDAGIGCGKSVIEPWNDKSRR